MASLHLQRLIGCLFLGLIVVGFAAAPSAVSQTAGHTLYGDIKVDESRAESTRPLSLTIVLYNLGGVVVGRQNIPTGGRYRFNNLRPGEYDLVVEAEMQEIARVRISLAGAPGSDFQKDLEFEWKSPGGASRPSPGAISTADLYQRSGANESRFKRAQAALDKKNFEEAITLLREVVAADPGDYQSWTELGTSFLLSNKQSDAEKSYEEALKARPDFPLALLNLGRVRSMQKKYAEAIEPLTMLVEKDPRSPDGNLLLGEAYLQTKKGSKAVPLLNEAARLGRPEAHLRLATLYDAVGLKDKAAAEYEQFLKKRPDYSERKKLEKYIADNRKAGS